MNAEERAWLYEVAGDATPGPWELEAAEVWTAEFGHLIAVASRLTDAEYIAAASPDVVRELIDTLNAAEASNAEHVLRAGLLRAQVTELEAKRDRLAGRLERTTSIYHGVVEAATEAVDAIDPDADVEGTVACIWWVRKYALSMRAERDRLAAALRGYTETLEAVMGARDLLESGRCLADITHRDEGHRQSVCMLPKDHAPLVHDDCLGCTWSDANHWEPSAVDALAAAVERVRALHNRQPSRLTGDYCAADGDDYPCPTRRALDGGGE